MSDLPIRPTAGKAVDYASGVSRNAPRPASVQDPAHARPADIGADGLAHAVEMVNQMLDPLSRSLQFSLDASTGKTVVKLVDRDTGNMLRQIPSSEMLSIGLALERVQGILIREKA